MEMPSSIPFDKPNHISHINHTNYYYQIFQKYREKYGGFSHILPEIIAIKYKLKAAATFYISSKKQLKEDYPLVVNLCKKEGLFISYTEGWRDDEEFIAIISSQEITPARDDMEENIGNRFSYPSCCVDLYKQRKYLPYHFENNMRGYILKRNVFDFRMNPFLVHSPFHLYLHLPCSLDCEKTLDYAKKLLNAIRREDKELYFCIVSFNKSLFFYTDICGAAVLLQGVKKGKKIFYENYYHNYLTEASIEKSKNNTMTDFALYEKLIEAISKGNVMDLKGGRLIISKNNKQIAVFHEPKHLFWKFIKFA